MRLILTAGAALLALSACSSNNGAANNSDANMARDNMAMDQNMDANMTADVNGMNSADANAAAAAGVNPSNGAAVDKLKEKDIKTHDADTNLANGI